MQMDSQLARGYKSPSQIARVVTEGWFNEWMYCAACSRSRLVKTRDNTKVVDFVCDNCGAEYQLKATSAALGKKLRDAAYGPMRERVCAGRSPHFAFLSYAKENWRVRSLLLVPSHFITLSAIEACAPLSSNARRAGWVGCSIRIDQLPTEAKVLAIENGRALPADRVRRKWRSFTWLANRKSSERAWTADVMRCVETIGTKQFALADVYRFEQEMSRLHPGNKNVRAKIRQQLQVLRDQGRLKFLGRGQYERL